MTETETEDQRAEKEKDSGERRESRELVKIEQGKRQRTERAE